MGMNSVLQVLHTANEKGRTFWADYTVSPRQGILERSTDDALIDQGQTTDLGAKLESSNLCATSTGRLFQVAQIQALWLGRTERDKEVLTYGKRGTCTPGFHQEGYTCRHTPKLPKHGVPAILGIPRDREC